MSGRQNCNLTMNKFIFFISFSLLLLYEGNTQNPNFTVWSQNYLNVYSYDGTTQTEAVTVQISKNGPLDVADWRLSLQVQPTTLWNGKVFPAEKITLHPNRISGSANDPGPLPNIVEIGAPASVPLVAGSEVYLVPRSNAPLYNVGVNNSYYEMKISFDLTVAGGDYLTDLKSGSPVYPMPMTFMLYGANNEVLGTAQVYYSIQVHENLSGAPPVENVFALQFSGDAQNGKLSLHTPFDYSSGVGVTYNNGLSLTTNTDYQLTVKSVQSDFSSLSGNHLPLDIVNVYLTPSEGGSVSIVEKALSQLPQVILTGSSTDKQPVFFDLNYRTNPNDQRLIQAKPEEYSTILQYELTPR